MGALARIRKAIAAGIGAGIAAYTNGALDGNVSTADWAVVVGSVIVFGAVAYLVPNAPADASPRTLSGPPKGY